MLASSTDLKEFKLHTFYSGFLSRLNLYNSLVKRQSSCLSPISSPCWSSDNHFRGLFQKTIEGFHCKING